jgi:hypothetical protein
MLASVNRRPHPVLVPGAWDFAGVLFAASGFLLFGGPAVLNGLYSNRRLAWLTGDSLILPGLAGTEWFLWAGIWAVYYGAVVCGAGVLLWARSHTTAVYNAEVELLADALDQAARRLGLTATRLGNRLVFAPAKELLAEADGHPGPGDEAPAGSIVSGRPGPAATATASAASTAHLAGTAVLDLEPFPAARHVTMVWQITPPGLRREVEAEVGTLLESVRGEPGPAAFWLLLAATLLLCVTFLGLVLMLTLLLLGRGGRF